MPELSNLLRQRLEAGENVSPVHPDADTLTAYVEQLLPSAERKGVLSHLSVCGECREVVALSLPQLPEPVAQGYAARQASFWSRLWTPSFRWAGAMAVIAVAAALVVELPRHQQGLRSEPASAQGVQSEAAHDVEQPKPAPAPEQPAVSGLTQASDKLTEAKTSVAPAVPPPMTANARMQPGFKDMQPAAVAAFPAKKETVGRPTAEEAKSAGFIAGSGKQDYVANYLFAANDTKTANSTYDYLPQAPAPQLTSQPGLAAGPPVHTPIFGGISATPDTTINKKSRLLMPLTPLKHLATCIFCKVADIGLGKTAPTSPAITSSAVITSAMDLHGKGSALLKDPPAMTAAASEKSGSGGELDRSEVFGRRAAAATVSPKLREGASAQYRWKVEDGKLFKSLDQDQWQDAYPRADANFEFSFVTSHGTDVWAGGSHATLLHSRDGVLWDPPVRLGDSASGKIVSIVASGLSVQVQTSTNQFWSSSDAGKTWVLQSGQE